MGASHYTFSFASSSSMASSSASPILFFLFVVITLLSPLQLLAREPQLFSKVTHNTDQNNNIVINNDVVEESEADPTSSTKQEEEQVPRFRPQTQTGYGLFGQESSQDDPLMEDVNNNEGERVYKYNNMDDLVMAERGGYMHRTRSANNMDNYERRRKNNVGRTDDDPYYFQNNNNNRYNVRQQGMSDTRFLENGKYFYDLNKESYNPTAYQNMRAVALSTNNVYSTAGANYNNHNHNHNDDAYYNNIAMERYRNQLHFQDTVDQQFMPSP